MTCETAAPTINERGDEAHPAFGRIAAARLSSTPGQVLFDSDITHQHTVRITVQGAVRRRDLHHDWIHESGPAIVEVELSEAQWASFVSSMNTSGVSCTIRQTLADHQIPGLAYDPRLAHSMTEVKTAATATFAKIAAALADYEAAVEAKAGAKVLREKLRVLHFAIEHTEGNLAFAARSLSEHAENVVQKARADIEAMVGAEAQRLGLTGGQAQGLLELPAIPGEGGEP